LRALTRRAAQFAMLASLAACGCSPEAPPKPQHVLLIVIDTLRADHLGVYGYERATSPVIDKLAQDGVRFERAISQSSWTSPSMVSMMTGHYIAQETMDIPGDLATLAESFQKAGWWTGAFVSSDLISAEHFFTRGFDRFEHIDKFGPNDKVVQWLRESKDRKTFTYIHLIEPHDPYEGPAAHRAFRDQHDLLPGDRAQFYAQLEKSTTLANSPQEIEHIKAEIGGYDDGVSGADERVGVFLAALDLTGLRSTTAIALTADHGEGLWEHIGFMNGQRAKKLREGAAPSLTNMLMPTHGNQVHYELVHVPLILVAPGLARGKVVRTPVENVDLFPTLLEFADLPSPGGLQGTSLLRAIDGSRANKAAAFSYTQFNTAVVDSDGMQLILPTDEGVCGEAIVPELFDLKSDPYQRHNLALEQPELVKQLGEISAQRVKIGIQQSGPMSSATMAALGQLGYLTQLEREKLRLKMEATDTGELVATLCTYNTHCIERLAAAEALAKRELDDVSKAALRAWRAKDSSAAVQRVLDGILGK
jgi:arylsulfatase